MGWGITIKNVDFLRVSKANIPSELIDAEDDVKVIREVLLMLVAGKGRKKVKGEALSQVEEIQGLRQEVSELIDSFEEAVCKRRLLSIANDNLSDVVDS